MTAQMWWYAAGAACVVVFLAWTFIDWRKKHPKAVKLTPSTIADDIPDLIAAAKLMQSVGSQAGVDAAMKVIGDRLAVAVTWQVAVPVAVTSGGETNGGSK